MFGVSRIRCGILGTAEFFIINFRELRMSFDDAASLILMGLILLLLSIFIFVVIKRYWINKKPISFGSQFVGENIYQQYQNEEKKRALEHVIYLRDEAEQ
jgi:hypothetical protein